MARRNSILPFGSSRVSRIGRSDSVTKEISGGVCFMQAGRHERIHTHNACMRAQTHRHTHNKYTNIPRPRYAHKHKQDIQAHIYVRAQTQTHTHIYTRTIYNIVFRPSLRTSRLHIMPDIIPHVATELKSLLNLLLRGNSKGRASIEYTGNSRTAETSPSTSAVRLVTVLLVTLLCISGLPLNHFHLDSKGRLICFLLNVGENRC